MTREAAFAQSREGAVPPMDIRLAAEPQFNKRVNMTTT
jgi:hypothetical protein